MGKLSEWAVEMLDHRLAEAFLKAGSLQEAIVNVVITDTIAMNREDAEEFRRNLEYLAKHPELGGHSSNYWMLLGKLKARKTRGVYLKGKGTNEER